MWPIGQRHTGTSSPFGSNLGLANPSSDANLEYTSSVEVTAPLVEKIVSQVHQLPEDSLIRSAQQEVRAERAKNFEERAERLKEVAPQKLTRCALDLAPEKGSSIWLTSLPLKEMGFNLNKREFRDGLSLRYDWPIADIPSTCLCGEPFYNRSRNDPGPGSRAHEHGLQRCSY